MATEKVRAAVVGAAIIALAACSGMDEQAVSSLRALRIQVVVNDGYLLRSEEGWSVRFAGVPLSAREEYRLGSHIVPATFLDLSAEFDSRAYLLRVYDARALQAAEREELRVLAERRVGETGRAGEPRVTRERDVEVHDVVVSELAGNPYHRVILRTFVLGGFVFEAVVIADRESGAPSDARNFFASIRLRGAQPADAPAPAPTHALSTPRVVAPPAQRAPAARPGRLVALRMIALRHDGPAMCVVVEGAAPTPCYLEVTADGSLRDAFHGIGRIGADFSITSRTGVPVFRLEPDGSLSGTGPMYGHTDLAQVLFCRLTVGPALECAHRFDPRLVEQNLIWNETNCAAAWIATVRGDEILVEHAGYPAQVAAKLIPAPADDDGRATALYLFALQAVEGETAMHAPREPE